MKNVHSQICAAILATMNSVAFAQSPSNDSIPVTPDNFVRAESDMNFKLGGIDLAGVGKMYHRRQPIEIDKQTVVRPVTIRSGPRG